MEKAKTLEEYAIAKLQSLEEENDVLHQMVQAKDELIDTCMEKINLLTDLLDAYKLVKRDTDTEMYGFEELTLTAWDFAKMKRDDLLEFLRKHYGNRKEN